MFNVEPEPKFEGSSGYGSGSTQGKFQKLTAFWASFETNLNKILINATFTPKPEPDPEPEPDPDPEPEPTKKEPSPQLRTTGVHVRRS